jgi:Ca2+-binding EF-hand superfamily protein
MMSTTSGISNMRAASMPKVTSTGTAESPHKKISNLFQQIDSSGSGRITKAQFEQAFNKLNLPESVKGIGQDAAFSKLDPSGTGTVSKQEFIRGMESLMTQRTHPARKDAAIEAKAAPVTKVQASNPVAQSPSLNLQLPTGVGATGNTINITA